MNRLFRLVAMFLAICWSLLAWGLYALVSFAGNGIARNVDWASNNPETVEWLFWGAGLLTSVGLAGIVMVWLAGLAVLGLLMFLIGRRVKLPAASAPRIST